MRRLLDYGERGALLECADLAETLGLLRTLHDAGFDDILEMVPGAETIFLRLARPLTRQRRHELRELEPTVVDTDAAEEVIITVSYDGEDLTEGPGTAG